MRIEIPKSITPLNVVGLKHKSTTLQMSRKPDFTDTDAFLFNGTNVGDEKNSFIINYELGKSQIAYIRYRITFENDLVTHWSPPKMVSGNNSSKSEYTLDLFSSIPATPKVYIKDFNFSNVPHTDFTIELDELAFYVGTGALVSTSYILRDINNIVVFSSIDNVFDLNSIKIGKEHIEEDGVYILEVYRNIDSNGVVFKTLSGIKVFNVTDDDSLDYADKSLIVDMDTFILYAHGQSRLDFTHGISNFQYLSVKFYDRNNILSGEENIIKASPYYINTADIEVGKTYRMQVIGYYLDIDGNIRNTLMRSKSYIAQKYEIGDEIPVPVYDLTKLGFKEIKTPTEEDIVFLNYSKELIDGSSPLYIRNKLIYLGYWLENGYVLNNNFISLKGITAVEEKVDVVQLIQKSNGNFLLLALVPNTNKVNIAEFKLLETGSIKNIDIVGQIVVEDEVLYNALTYNSTTKIMITSNSYNKNIIAKFKDVFTWGANVSNYLNFSEFDGTTLISRFNKAGNGTLDICEIKTQNYVAIVNLNKVDDKISLDINFVNLFNLSNIDYGTAVNINSEDNPAHPVIVSLKSMFDANLQNGLNTSLVLLDSKHLLFTVNDKITNSFNGMYIFNITTNTWSLSKDITGLARDYKNQVTAGYNIYKSDNDKNLPLVKLI